MVGTVVLRCAPLTPAISSLYPNLRTRLVERVAAILLRLLPFFFYARRLTPLTTNKHKHKHSTNQNKQNKTIIAVPNQKV